MLNAGTSGALEPGVENAGTDGPVGAAGVEGIGGGALNAGMSGGPPAGSAGTVKVPEHNGHFISWPAL